MNTFYVVQEDCSCNSTDDNPLCSTQDIFKEVKTILKKSFELLRLRNLLINEDIANESIEVDNTRAL